MLKSENGNDIKIFTRYQDTKLESPYLENIKKNSSFTKETRIIIKKLN